MILALLGWALAEDAVRVEMVFPGLRNDEGQLVVRLFCSPDGFPKQQDKACQTAAAPVVDGKAVVVFDALPVGTYAVSALHDEDEDGDLDTFLGIPKEGVGMIGTSSGIPTFEDASIVVAGDKTLTGSMVYLL